MGTSFEQRHQFPLVVSSSYPHQPRTMDQCPGRQAQVAQPTTTRSHGTTININLSPNIPPPPLPLSCDTTTLLFRLSSVISLIKHYDLVALHDQCNRISRSGTSSQILVIPTSPPRRKPISM